MWKHIYAVLFIIVAGGSSAFADCRSITDLFTVRYAGCATANVGNTAAIQGCQQALEAQYAIDRRAQCDDTPSTCTGARRVAYDNLRRACATYLDVSSYDVDIVGCYDSVMECTGFSGQEFMSEVRRSVSRTSGSADYDVQCARGIELDAAMTAVREAAEADETNAEEAITAQLSAFDTQIENRRSQISDATRDLNGAVTRIAEIQRENGQLSQQMEGQIGAIQQQLRLLADQLRADLENIRNETRAAANVKIQECRQQAEGRLAELAQSPQYRAVIATGLEGASGRNEQLEHLTSAYIAEYCRNNYRATISDLFAQAQAAEAQKQRSYETAVATLNDNLVRLNSSLSSQGSVDPQIEAQQSIIATSQQTLVRAGQEIQQLEAQKTIVQMQRGSMSGNQLVPGAFLGERRSAPAADLPTPPQGDWTAGAGLERSFAEYGHDGHRIQELRQCSAGGATAATGSATERN